MDRLREMEVFLEIAEAGSFAEAARRLRLSPPAVTRLVASLEQRLGTRLITRTTRSMRLTEAGERFRVDAGRILADLAAAENEAAGETAAPRGTLAITAPTSFGRMVVAPVVARFLARHPEVSANLLLVDRVVNLVEEGMDVGLRIGELPDSRLIARRVGEVRRVLVASPAYLARHGAPDAPQALKDHTFIAFTGLMRTRGLGFGPGAAHHVALAPRLEVNDAAAAIALAEAGDGITVALSYMVRDALAAGRLREVLADPPEPPRPVQLIYPETRLLSPAVRAFVDLAAPAITAHLAGEG
jgi:DNA-binding transcriptional LysR family regulator